jgi:hypothetical protein
MARTAAPKSSNLRIPTKEYDSNGKIKNWSVLWDEARDLEALVVGGRLDGLGAKEIRDRYPQWQAFSYKPFHSGLTNLRKKHNKEVKARSDYADHDGECKLNRKTDVFSFNYFILTSLS